MARGPFEGTWQQGIRPTVVTAPDALVYINGESEVIGCGSCFRKFDLNKYITSIQVDLSVESAPGSASISLAIPRHSVDDFFFDGNPLVTPMMEVEIYAKGYFLVEGMPQYYPIFWGMVTEVSDDFSGGAHTVSINCADILKWWELCKMNINPAFTQGSGQLGTSIYGNVLFGSNPYDLIWTLAQQAFGDVVVGSGSLVSLYKEGTQKQTFNAALADIMAYWQKRFSKIRSNLLLYGTRGNAVRGDMLYQSYQKQGGGSKFKNSKAVPFASQAVRQANGGEDGSQMVFDPTSPAVTAFRTQFSQAGQVNFWSSEFQTKLEIANACKEAIGFEFYMDVTGDIVFKPPFYNLDILSNKPVSWVQDIDIYDWNLQASEAEVVTQVQIQGSFGGNIDYGMGEEVTPHTSVTDYHLIRKFGWRTQTINSEFSGNTLQMFYIGLDTMDRVNSRQFTGSVNIPLRPELRLGFPIYLAPKDQIWYVRGISHNIEFGGRAQTSLSLTAKRSKFIAPQGIGSITLSGLKTANGTTQPITDAFTNQNAPTTQELARGGTFKADVGSAAQLPPINAPDKPGDDNPYAPLILRHPKTNRLVGYPNVVMAYTRPFVNPPQKDFNKISGQKEPGAKRVPNPIIKQVNDQGANLVDPYTREAHTVSDADKLREKYLNNRYTYGLNSAGVYTYLHDRSSVLKEFILVPAKNIEFANDDAVKLEGSSGMIRPISDERGFEVIGHFRYGRGTSLRDGSLVLEVSADNPNALNSRAEVSPQLALSGALTETLVAQSSGLTTQITNAVNPAAAIANLTPEDLQTAGTINPDTKEPEFAPAETNFVQAAPIGSPGQVGLTNSSSLTDVEASQLSRALTLAEMTVREDVPTNDDCSCLLSRSDLSFINVGYEISAIRSSGPVNASIGRGSIDENTIGSPDQAKAIEDRIRAEAQAKIADIEAQESVPGIFQEAKDKIIADAAAQITAEKEAAGINEALMDEALAEDRPVTDVVRSFSHTISQVESFLTNLYTVLDDSHQEYEQALRGDLIQIPQVNAEDVRFGIPKDLGNVSPPFGQPGRALGGDPEALALEANGAFNEAVDAWGDLGEQLQADARRAEIQAAIGALNIQASALNSQIATAQQLGQTATGAQAALDGILQQIANLQQELNVLNQQYP